MNERTSALRDRARRSHRVGDPEQEALGRESRALTEGEPDVIRNAKAFAHYCANRTVVISDRELIVGSSPSVEYDPEKEATPEIFGRQGFASHWAVSEGGQAMFREGMLSGAGNHTTMDYDTVLAIGFAGLIERIRERIGRLTPDEPDVATKREFLEALIIMAEGYIVLSDRYADHADALAREADGPVRRAELESIARNCRRVPAGPATTFQEACQAAWFCFFFLPDAPGRVDQYLNPFYERDLARGAVTPEAAHELLSCLWIHYYQFAGARQGVSALQHLTLGGVKPDGSDASNELTRICLNVTEDLRLHRPQVGLRWNKDTPPDLLRRAVRILRTHSGNPDFCNDEQIVPALVKIGVAPEDAREFSLSGCHEVIVTGRAQMGSVEGFVNLPKILRIALGLEPTLAPGADTASIETYADLWRALEDAMELVAGFTHEASLARDSQAAEDPGGNLGASLVVNDCIENALGYTQGGARYNHCNWDIIGLANLADSLAAIRQLVFEDRELTLPQLVDILRADWDGHESLRRRVLSRMPHYGNDQDDVDGIAASVVERFSAILKRRTPFRGGEYILGTTAGGENMHVEFGRLTGATPDGRTAGTSLADSIGAAHGRDTQGVTALLNSVAKLPHSLLPTATTLNVKLDPSMLAGDSGIDKIAALIEGHFLSGGQQCQFNTVTREMLLEAREHPEEHGDLMVRVAGYSAPFTALWDDLQDEVIARTEHAL